VKPRRVARGNTPYTQRQRDCAKIGAVTSSGAVIAMPHSHHFLAIAASLCAAMLAGCASAVVQPWEKGLLARPDMALEPDRLESGFAEHVYASKEAAQGGAGAGASGCGCN
jgi:hypothetical protein